MDYKGSPVAFVLNSILSDTSIVIAFLSFCICFFVISVSMKYLFPSSHFESVCVLCPEVVIFRYIVGSC